MHNTPEVLLKNHQIMPYKRKTDDINNFGIVKNKCYTNNRKNHHKYRKMSPQTLIFLLITVIIILLCCTTTGVNCNIITTNKNYLSSTKPFKSIDSNNDSKNNNKKLTTKTTKEDYLKSLQEVFNNNFKNSSSIDKFNISETEFTTKYREYLELVEYRRQKDALLLSQVKASNSLPKSRRRRAIDNNDLIYMHFDLSANLLNDSSTTIDEASLIISLARNRHRNNEPPYGSRAARTRQNNTMRRGRRNRHLKIHVYQLSESFDRIWLDTINITTHKFPNHRKVKLNVHRAVSEWMKDMSSNQGLQLYCENCHAHGVYVVHENGMNSIPGSAYPTLQLILKGRQREKRWQRSFKPVVQDYFSRRHTKCTKKSDKCCRRQLKVQFKELNLDFVIQPKMFDAGYCEGSCPTAYNPAHEHAVLQARLADTGKYNIPRPCCTASILSDVDVLHVDEDDDTKLKVTTFKNMRVLQCACS